MAGFIRPLLGPKDAMSLGGIGAASAAALPMFAGNPLALGALGLGVLGAGYLTWSRLGSTLNRVDLSVREDFVLPSDSVYPESMGLQGLRLGYTRDQSLPVDLDNGLLMRHMAIVGQSGVGKTTIGEYILFQQMVRGGGFLFIDGKLDADTRDKLGYLSRLTGRELDFYILNIDDPENSHTYNPILNGDPDEVASRLLNLIPSTANNAGADFYRQAANQALTVLIGALKVAKYRYHFGDLAILLQSAPAIDRLERLVPEGSPEKRSLQIFLEQFKRKNKDGVQIDVNRLKEVVGGMSGRIAMFAQGKFAKIFNTYAPEIDLTDIVLNNKMAYIMLPTMGKEEAALNLGKMILSDLRTAVYKAQAIPKYKRPDPPFLCFADEMGSYVMPGITRVFEQARSASICMLPAFQSFSQLSQVSPEFTDMIIQNTWTKIYFKFGSKDSSEMAAEVIGKHIKHSLTVAKSENESASSNSLRLTPQQSEGASGGTAVSAKETEEHRVKPDHIKSLGIGQAILQVGARVFHINTPMVNFPEGIPEYRIIRHPTSVPQGERTLNFENIYRQFLLESSAPQNGEGSPDGPAPPDDSGASKQPSGMNSAKAAENALRMNKSEKKGDAA